ncbi:MAG TPA: hypothetical protein VN927_01990 [Gemmatimonadaceae bacterium]|jgi:hypothetical protein|nr:hypothetical protein [Gemmatimonadaceae bacterium]
MNRGRLGRYSLWQFRDFAVERGVAILIIGFLWGYVLIAPFRAVSGQRLNLNPSSPAWPLLITVASSIVSLSVLIAVNGIVSIDRKLGYYRFLFSKPVSVVAYYSQLFLVNMVGVVAAMLILSGILRTIVPDFSIVNYLLYTALIFVAMGGIGFFLSVATRFDWVTLAAVWLGSRTLREFYGAKPGLPAKLVQVLPPLHRLDDVANGLITNGNAATSDLIWLAGYGALFFVLGLVLLHKGSLAD